MLIEVERTTIQSDEVPHSSVSSRHIIDDTPEGPDERDKSGNGRSRTALNALGKWSLFSDFSFKTLLRAIEQVPNSDISAAESESTLFRFFRSCHVRDLKLIATAAVVICGIQFGTVLLLALSDAGYFFFSHKHDPVAALSEFVRFVIIYMGPAMPVYGLVLGWAYQAASKRLGIVDLFACEIGTLCRVGTIFDIGNQYVERYHEPSAENGGCPQHEQAPQHDFVSQEDYFPVFQSNSRDLQSLEASVVNDITQFYTYMKAQRDAQRRLAGMKLPETTGAQKLKETDSKKCHSDAETHAWRAAMMNVIYLTFLGYESARKAISSLVEYQPARAERLIVILLTELSCFAFLHQHFHPEDLRGRRLQLRVADYKEQVVTVYDQVMPPHNKNNEEDWLPAQKTLPDLESRYKEALGEELADAWELRRQRLAKRKHQDST